MKNQRIKNREIKFRGLRVDGKGWAYGYYACMSGESEILVERGWNVEPDVYQKFTFDKHLILDIRLPDQSGWDYRDCFSYHEVRSETVGQFTGLRDRSGSEIYDGDIISLYRPLSNNTIPMYEVLHDGVDYVLDHYGRSDSNRWGRLSRIVDADILHQFGGMVVFGNIHEIQNA